MANTHPWVLGLTGGIGSGKSSASKFFAELGIEVVDADQVARQVVEPSSPALTAIVKRHGEAIIDNKGALDRAKLRKIIFSDNNEKQWLNNLLHPQIRTEMLTQLANAQSPYVILEAPLLFENGLEKYCQRTLLIDVQLELQLTRTCERDKLPLEAAKAIIAAQMSRSNKVKKADDIISNSGTLAALKVKVQRYHYSYLNIVKLQSRPDKQQ
ncbi:dephospho-CoA kinase [Pseudoalteromonas sp. BDTF-M6]|uniref:dephospho-CoA kinase n=1 Tax=Pseudoalteromonas sp. BDTF-M6 TaxID=2796132 RepID=UPI001BAEF037|nr:dephospho-CoA kinase [Pseudoalteromonas sp. BDTF-M6]MBS3797393.1 dephospho-CoA kinase [Pseudoalteromonas sp. BDTF-M6]